MKSATHSAEVPGPKPKDSPEVPRVPDFGTYHHSSMRESVSTRTKIRAIFAEAFEALPFDRNERLRILDMGCGLGFLSTVCAERYSRALITGVDTFAHSSLKGSSIARAKENSEILGFSDRITFEEGDILTADFRRKTFELFVSNLVFHNLGERRFEAYRRVASWMPPEAFCLLGDLFFEHKANLKFLSTIFNTIKEVKPARSLSEYSLFVLSGAPAPIRVT